MVGTICVLGLLFYWVPFVIAAYFVDVWRPAHRERSRRDLDRPERHIGSRQPASAY